MRVPTVGLGRAGLTLWQLCVPGNASHRLLRLPRTGSTHRCPQLPPPSFTHSLKNTFLKAYCGTPAVVPYGTACASPVADLITSHTTEEGSAWEKLAY